MQTITDLIQYLQDNLEATLAALATVGAFVAGLVAIVKRKKGKKP